MLPPDSNEKISPPLMINPHGDKPDWCITGVLTANMSEHVLCVSYDNESLLLRNLGNTIVYRDSAIFIPNVNYLLRISNFWIFNR